MPSKYSENLKQAIQYIRAGETEIAREIILEIIQNDPDYEKAWIWLVETVADRDGKIDILKTRIEQFPDSPLARKALEHLAPEVLNHLQSGDEAIFIPPSAKLPEKPSKEADKAIEYGVDVQAMGEDRFSYDDDSTIEFEEPSKESGELFTGENLFGEDDESDISSEFASLLEDEEDEDADEVLEQDLEAFLRGSLDDEHTDQPAKKRTPSGDMTFTDWLKGEDEQEEEEPVDELALLMAQDSDPAGKKEGTSASNPFVLSREESMALFGEDVLKEPEKEPDGDALDELRSVSSGDSKSAFPDEFIDAFDLDEALFPDTSSSQQRTSVSADDLLELENGLRKEVVTGTPPPARPKAAKTKKQGNKNATFIWGCSVLAVIMIISLLGLAWLFFQNRRNAPPSPTSTAAPSATPTEVYTLVAPWLEDATPTPEGE